MDTVKGHAKILPEQPTGRDPLQHSKKISLIYTVCFMILFATAGFVMLESLHGKNTQQDESVFNRVRSSDLIEVVCNKTMYFEVCNSSLCAHPGALQANASELASIAVEVSRDVAEDVVQLTLDLNKTAEEDAPRSRVPLSDCVELLGDSIDELNDSLCAMADRNWTQRSEDLNTWLSAALTNPFTCIDGFEEVGVCMPLSLKQKVDYLTQLISNALAIVNYVAGVGANTGKTQRTSGMNSRLLSRG